jgi:hypothetical protein
MNEKRRPNSEEHRAMGVELHAIRGRLLAVGRRVTGAYPKQSRASLAYIKATEALDRLRSELDNAACLEHPADFLPTWYYPGLEATEQRTAITPDRLFETR